MKFSIATTISLAVCVYGAVVPEEKLLVQTPFLQAHDAAMAYFPNNNTLCNTFKAQSLAPDSNLTRVTAAKDSAFTALLDCGVRSLDLRIKACAQENPNGKLCMVHSAAVVRPQTLESELPSVVGWAAENPEELIILKIVPENEGKDPPSPDTIDALNNLLKKHNITSIHNADRMGNLLDGCWGKGATSSWPLSVAREKASSTVGGGRILAVFKYDVGSSGQPAATSCVEDNYVPTIGYNPKTANVSFAKLEDYVNNTLSTQFSRVGSANPAVMMQELQLIWQTMGTLPFNLPYGILKVSAASDLNQFVLANIKDFLATGNVNMVKVNNVCDGGMDLAEALGTKVTPAQRDRCIASCGGYNVKNQCL